MKKKKNSDHLIAHQRRRLHLTIVALFACFAMIGLATEWLTELVRPSDKLAYTVTEGTEVGLITSLKLYDSKTDENRTLIENFKGGHFSFSVDGRIAYQDYDMDSNIFTIYLLDTTDENPEAIDITSNLLDGAWLGLSNMWSPDGNYLLYRTADTGIYLWDGQQSIDITPENVGRIPMCRAVGVSWRSDGQVALGIADDCELYSDTEIYIWNGEITVNLSPNPDGYDGAFAWSPDGQLAFESVRENQHGIWIWDGESYRDGVPDTAKFEFVDTDADKLLWTNDNRLIIDWTNRTQNTQYRAKIWDGETLKHIVREPDMTSFSARWSQDGRLAFISYGESGLNVVVRDTYNREIASFPGYDELAWSADGRLAYATGQRELLIWDGREHIQLSDNTWETYGRWQSGASLNFSFWVG